MKTRFPKGDAFYFLSLFVSLMAGNYMSYFSYVQEEMPLEHRGVPQAHAGLHGTLYGDGEDHGASVSSVYGSQHFTSSRCLNIHMLDRLLLP